MRQPALVVLDLSQHRHHRHQQPRLGQRGQDRALVARPQRLAQRRVGRPVIVVESGKGQAAFWLHPPIVPGGRVSGWCQGSSPLGSVADLCEPGCVPDFNDLTLLPFCVGLTLLGLIGSWAAWRRRGLASGVRGVAWSLLPVSLYMTGLLELLWDVVKSVSSWVTHLIFSPTVWAGVALFGVSVVLYVVSGVAKGRRGGTPEKTAKSKPASDAIGELTATGPPAAALSLPRSRPSRAKAAKAGSRNRRSSTRSRTS